MDFVLYKALNGYAVGHDGFEDPMRLITVEAQFVFMVLLGALFVVGGRWRSRSGRRGVVAAGFSALLALGVAHLITDVWARPPALRGAPGRRAPVRARLPRPVVP